MIAIQNFSSPIGWRNDYLRKCGVGSIIVAFIFYGCAQPRTIRQCNELGTPYERYDCMRDSIFGAETRAMRTAISTTVFRSAISFGLSGGCSTLDAVQVIAGNVQIPSGINGRNDGGFQLYWNDLVAKTNNNRKRMASAALADIRADSYSLSRFVQAFSEVCRTDEYRIKNIILSNKIAQASIDSRNKLAGILKNERDRQSERLEIIISLTQLTALYKNVFINLNIESSVKAQQGIDILEMYQQKITSSFYQCDRALETVELGLGGEFGEKISALSCNKISSESERAILSESIMGGAAVGSAVGTVAALIWGHSNKDTLIGAGVGLLGGAVAGRVIGLNRIQEIRDLTLENDKLRSFLRAADITNKQIAERNRELSDQINRLRLKKKSDAEQKRIAQQRLSQAQKQQKEIKKLMDDRKVIADALLREQKKQYEKRLEDLEKQDKKLSALITQLEDIAEDGRIG